MDLHEPYRRLPTATEHLEQGDIIGKSSYVSNELLAKYHPYYAQRTINEYFAVLTQSCDLVRRPHATARYISLAPVRPLQEIAAREFERELEVLPGEKIAVGSDETKGRYLEFLKRLFNNNNPRYFFLPEHQNTGFGFDMCVVLALAISVKVEHYEQLLQARIAQLDELYQAKLGWLLGQQYSRVGTHDWPEPASDEKARKTVLRARPTWMPERELIAVRRAVAEKLRADAAFEVDEDALKNIRRSVKSRLDQAIDAIFDVLIAEGLLVPDRDATKPRLRALLRNNEPFKSHIVR